MIEKLYFGIAAGSEAITGALARYALMTRTRRTCDVQEVRLLAFGIGRDEVRLVVEGSSAAIAQVSRGVKIGTVNALAVFGVEVVWGRTAREEVTDLTEAVAWAHRAPVEAGAADPLASPWSSHRDLMGYRLADFFDASGLRDRVDALVVHELAGGEGVPDGWPPAAAQREPLHLLLRVAASVFGVLPADRKCFRLFVHLGRARGWTNDSIANALALSARRVRQMFAEPEAHLDLALLVLGHESAMRVP